MQIWLKAFCLTLAFSGSTFVHATDPAREAEELIQTIHARWYDATEPRHLNKILDLQITRVLALLMPEVPELEQLAARMRLNRFAGDVDEFHRRLGVDGDLDQRIDVLADLTTRMLIAGLASDRGEDAFASVDELTKALVPLIEAHLLVGVVAGTRPEGFGVATITHWLHARRDAERSRDRFWTKVRDGLAGQPAWMRLDAESADTRDARASDAISARVVRLIAAVTDPAAACRQALGP